MEFQVEPLYYQERTIGSFLIEAEYNAIESVCTRRNAEPSLEVIPAECWKHT